MSARRVIFHGQEILNHVTLNTRIKFATINYYDLDVEYSCGSEGLALFIDRIKNNPPVLSQDCHTTTSNNGAASMLLVRQNSNTLGIARTATICHSDYYDECNNR